ncbi:hypothetical protein P865_10035 [Brucella abortus 82]|nr:hypothetical protein P408_00120 [Brucella abortus S99]ERM86125.1 hypothetical protein P865_10035 [Brucella abortus 82]EXU84391.1 hypothetical protein AX23_14800 [Brucella melitensis 548]
MQIEPGQKHDLVPKPLTLFGIMLLVRLFSYF